jgi:hypothetical protein
VSDWLEQRTKLVNDLNAYDDGNLALTKTQYSALHKAFRQIESACNHEELVHIHKRSEWDDEYGSWHHSDKCTVVCKYHQYPIIKQGNEFSNGTQCAVNNKFFEVYGHLDEFACLLDNAAQRNDAEWSERERMYVLLEPKVAAPSLPPPKPSYTNAVEAYERSLVD